MPSELEMISAIAGPLTAINAASREPVGRGTLTGATVGDAVTNAGAGADSGG